jgi:predicted TIM-barrel fold metal-dependent hydrolase
MLIVDAQVHTWAASTPERPWSGGGEPQRTVPFTNEDLLKEMDVAGVHRVVLVPPGWEGSRNDLALAAAHAHPDRFAVMGRIAPQVLSKSQGALIGWRKQPGMLGLRLAMNVPKAPAILGSGKLDWLWKEAEAEGVPLMTRNGSWGAVFASGLGGRAHSARCNRMRPMASRVALLPAHRRKKNQ